VDPGLTRRAPLVMARGAGGRTGGAAASHPEDIGGCAVPLRGLEQRPVLHTTDRASGSGAWDKVIKGGGRKQRGGLVLSGPLSGQPGAENRAEGDPQATGKSHANVTQQIT